MIRRAVVAASLLAMLGNGSGARACIDGRMEEVALTPERRAHHEKELKSTRETISELEKKGAPQGQINAWKRGAVRTEHILRSGREEVFRPAAKSADIEVSKAPSSRCAG